MYSSTRVHCSWVMGLLSLPRYLRSCSLMPSKMNSKPIWASLLLAFSLSNAAHAQTVAPAAPTAPVWYPQVPLAHVRIDAAPSVELKVVYTEAPPGTEPVARCQDHCDFWAWPGKYTLYARDRSTGKQKQLPLRIKRSSRYVYEAGDDGRATAGLVVAGVGSAAAVTALVLLTKSLVSSYCAGDC